MKTATVVGLFVLVACLQLQANGAQFRRAIGCKTKSQDFQNVCEFRRCDEDTGIDTVVTCEDVIGVVNCPEGTVEDWLDEDLSKEFPECCARPYCRDA